MLSDNDLAETSAQRLMRGLQEYPWL